MLSFFFVELQINTNVTVTVCNTTNDFFKDALISFWVEKHQNIQACDEAFCSPLDDLHRMLLHKLDFKGKC